MSIELLKEGCRHIEMAVHDVPSACSFMERTLGASRVEQKLVKAITGVVLDIDHMGCGSAVFQFCGVIDKTQPHQRYLEQFEQGISTIVFLVKNLKATIAAMDPEALAQRRGEYLGCQDSGRNLYAPAATAYRLKAKDILGFDVELVESE